MKYIPPKGKFFESDFLRNVDKVHELTTLLRRKTAKRIIKALDEHFELKRYDIKLIARLNKDILSGNLKQLRYFGIIDVRFDVNGDKKYFIDYDHLNYIHELLKMLNNEITTSFKS